MRKVNGHMITVIIHYPHCGSNALVRNGQSPNGKQKYLCRACRRQSRENPTPYAYPEERREEILRAYEERSGLRGLERIFGVSRNTVIAWIKKALNGNLHLIRAQNDTFPLIKVSMAQGKIAVQQKSHQIVCVERNVDRA